MELLEAIRTRRSIKAFDPDHEMSDEELRFLFSNAALTPSSFNMQNWHFVAVRDRDVKQALCEAAWNQRQVREASLVVVIAGVKEAYRRTDRYLRNLPPESARRMGRMIEGIYGSDEMLKIQEACRSAGLVGMTLMLLAKEMGYDSCPMIGYDAAKVAEIVGLPADCPPLLMVTIGRARSEPGPRPGLLDLEELVSVDRYGNHAIRGPVPDA